MRELNVHFRIKATVSGRNIINKLRFNSVLIQDNKIDFCYNDNIIYTLYYNKSDGVYKKNESEIIIAPRENKVILEFKKENDSVDINIDTTDIFYNAFKDYLTEYNDIPVDSNSKKDKTKTPISEKEQCEKRENIFKIIGIVGVIVQFVFFLIAKFNLKNTYNEEVIGKIQIGNMIGADTSVSHSSSTTGLGVFAAVMMGVCCISFFVLAVLSAKKGTGKYMPLFGVFAVLTIIGGFIVALF